MDVLLGIDLGTQGVRSGIYTVERELLAGSQRRIGTRFPRPGWAEQDPRGVVGRYGLRLHAHELRPVAGDSAQVEAIKIVARTHKTARAENFIRAGEKHDAPAIRDAGLRRLVQSGTATARGGRYGMMRDCAVATGLLDGDEHVRGPASSSGERSGQGR